MEVTFSGVLQVAGRRARNVRDTDLFACVAESS